MACSGVQTRYHHVSNGETVSSIAQKYEVSVASLRSVNEIRGSLRQGTKLYIPFEESANWDSDYEESSETEKAAPAVEPPAAPDLSKVSFSWPVSGRVSSYFGLRRRLRGSRSRRHQGIDIAAPNKTPVRASRSGHVIYAGNRIPGYGNLVILRHQDSFSTVYAHLSKIRVKKGQFISRNQLVGLVGKTGRATNYHLHFEVRNGTRPVNPLLYLSRYYAKNP